MANLSSGGCHAAPTLLLVAGMAVQPNKHERGQEKQQDCVGRHPVSHPLEVQRLEVGHGRGTQTHGRTEKDHRYCVVRLLQNQILE
jgi:hypothetical protein